ncbi:MAG: hypothetical protein ABWY25_02165 [Paenisporosarcina sp.]
MESSILISTKKILGVAQEYTAFDLDIITHINAAFSTLCQLGVGPTEGFAIEDEADIWDDFIVPSNQMNMVRTYIYLKTRMFFDPPTTSFHIDAMNKQIAELEWRLNVFREVQLPNGEVA